MDLLNDELRALALLIAANAAPLVLGKFLGKRAALPLDFGLVLSDGERLFGSHKTWRGLIFGTACCALVAMYLGLPVHIGIGFALVSLAADAASSAVKRRKRLPPGTETQGLDQIGETLLPLLVYSSPLSLAVSEVLIVTVAFMIIESCTTAMRQRRWFDRASS